MILSLGDGSGVVDLDELASACPPPGCLIRSAWVGAGHVGLCAVDGSNNMAGSRAHRALFRFRHRIFHRWGVPHTPLEKAASAIGSSSSSSSSSSSGGVMSSSNGDGSGGGGGGGLPVVLVVQTKRIVTNLQAFVSAINTAGIAKARLIRWETMSFVDQLNVMRGAAVQVSQQSPIMMTMMMMWMMTPALFGCCRCRAWAPLRSISSSCRAAPSPSA